MPSRVAGSSPERDGSLRYRLADLAARLGGEVRGDPERRIAGVASLETAGPQELSFVTHRRFVAAGQQSRAGALLVPPSLEESLEDVDLLVHRDPELALVALLELFHPKAVARPGVHPSAVLEEGCEVDPSAEIGALAFVGTGSTIGPRTILHAAAVVGRGCRIGADVVLHPHVVLYDGTEIGDRVVIHGGTVIGADGFRYVGREDGLHKVPQVGRVVIEEDVEIGANSAVDRAGLDVTRVGAGTKIDNLVQIGHNVVVGRHAVICGQAGIAGSAKLGDGVVLAGKVGVLDHSEMENGARAMGQAFVSQRVPAGETVAGSPAMPAARWRRQIASLRRLEDTRHRILDLEKEVASLRQRLQGGSEGDRD